MYTLVFLKGVVNGFKQKALVVENCWRYIQAVCETGKINLNEKESHTP